MHPQHRWHAEMGEGRLNRSPPLLHPTSSVRTEMVRLCCGASRQPDMMPHVSVRRGGGVVEEGLEKKRKKRKPRSGAT